MFANSVMNVGSTYLAGQEYEQAIPLLERAQMIRMAHVDELAKSDPKLQRDLAMGHYQLAIVRRELDDVTEAESSFLTAVEVFKRLLETEPNGVPSETSRCRLRSSRSEGRSGRITAGAIEYFRQAEESGGVEGPQSGCAQLRRGTGRCAHQPSCTVPQTGAGR